MGPEDLAQVLSHLPKALPNPAVLVGLETGDDAAVYQVQPDLALVVTTDFFTPIVDDAFTFGAISAANALSDVYAMGGTPLLALNLVAFPIKELPHSVLTDILRGGLEKVREAGIDIVGGHSIDDHEPKYGLAVVGTVRPSSVVRNRGGQPGDRLVLTKPIGTGIITTAIKHDVATPSTAEAATATMLALNARAAEAMVEVGAHAATDITGFGLLGHLHYLARASGVAAEVRAATVPLLPDALALAAAGEIPGGTRRNEQFLRPLTRWEGEIPAATRIVLADAQTSGGLLIAVSPERETALHAALQGRGVSAATIGALRPGPPGQIVVHG